ncbi:modulator of macroautophagy TMEM150B-like [Kryptolebias marmoratus]|uniref:modulator of macroautophagy TMEM150B-like n=1 Tax=Kryptolebias marmoratus TaxID=37003 RepID=UPI0007F8C5D2|nr:modulator of macroautophagy TMEM150B-like [Kryptolebias marmoratus]
MSLWFLIPVVVALNGILGIWTVYGIAVRYGSVNITESFPYISDCGNQPPASCWFSQICNNGCILGLIFEVLRFRSLSRTAGHLNKASLALGVISSVGLSFTGNFQSSAIKGVHYTGAFLAFVSGLAYLCIQVGLMRSYIMKYVGIFLCCCCAVLLLLFFIFHLMKYVYPAAICEWTLATMFFTLYPVFVFEFAKMDCSFTVKTKPKCLSGSG